ncbi:flippase-like domain-containing protein [Halogeometricum luteum]|uniref:Flippase-like domain-containing protein n=1 Tax=Halogeometricum luteum TaxID=2950537 RepID=A0ABU2FYC9_9EURY|nr:flippase-like domain-containing protein [Halogeometricum sp. S3BR5-2]MDS0293510.1 flippase-like domain-containing protein [Halogeometricum sp. S3BR5-2]
MGRPTTEQSVTEVSVVLPAYNEEDTIEETVEETLRTLSSFLPADSFEVIVAEDGCDDRTPELAERMAARDDRVRHFHSDERLGRGGALEHAFAAANGEVLVYFDTDLATDMSHLEELVDRVRSGRYDVATGSRWMPGRVADRPTKRGVPSRAFNLLVRLFLGSSLRDHQCGFKAFSREAFQDLRTQVEDEHWFWDTEMLVRAQRAGYRVDEFPVDWTPKGDTKVDLVRDVFGMGSQIVRTWWQVAVKPRVTQRVALAAGAILTLLALVLMTQYISFGAVLDQMQAADPVLVAVAALVYVLSWPVRGVRYRDILAELGFREKASFLTGAVFISQTGNLVFPARLGDFIRAYVVKARRGIPYPSGFASLAAERVFDLLTITALAGVVLVGYTVTGQTAELAETVVGAEGAGQVAVLVAVGVALAAILAVAVIIASAQSDGNLAGRLVRRASSDSYAELVAKVVERFVDDLQAVAGTRRGFARIGVSSLGIWMLDVATAMLVLAAFDPGLAPIEFVSVCFFAVSVGNLAKVLPLSPGGVGLYEGAFTLLVIGLTGISPELALGAAVLDHAVKNIVTVVGGYASMLGLNVSLTTAVEESKEVRESREAEPAELD